MYIWGYQRKHALGSLRTIGLFGVICKQAFHSAARCQLVGVPTELVCGETNALYCSVTIKQANQATYSLLQFADPSPHLAAVVLFAGDEIQGSGVSC